MGRTALFGTELVPFSPRNGDGLRASSRPQMAVERYGVKGQHNQVVRAFRNHQRASLPTTLCRLYLAQGAGGVVRHGGYVVRHEP